MIPIVVEFVYTPRSVLYTIYYPNIIGTNIGSVTCMYVPEDMRLLTDERFDAGLDQTLLKEIVTEIEEETDRTYVGKIVGNRDIWVYAFH